MTTEWSLSASLLRYLSRGMGIPRYSKWTVTRWQPSSIFKMRGTRITANVWQMCPRAQWSLQIGELWDNKSFFHVTAYLILYLSFLFHTLFSFYAWYITSSCAFTSNLLRTGMIEKFSHDVLQQTCRTYESLLPALEHVIYLKRDVKFCLSNIAKRGKVGKTILPQNILKVSPYIN